jgi:hypothetical protein
VRLVDRKPSATKPLSELPDTIIHATAQRQAGEPISRACWARPPSAEAERASNNGGWSRKQALRACG